MEQQGGNYFPQDVSTTQDNSDVSWNLCFKIIARFRPLRYLLQWLHKVCSWLKCLFSMEAIDSHKRRLHSPGRTIRPAKKRLGVVARILFAFIPPRLQVALGFLNTMCQSVVLEETLKSPVRPSMKGNKRKQEDLALEEYQCWIETFLKELPDDDEPEDLTYEPTKSETDSEEYKSQNNTETDLEYEEKDGLLMLKEDPVSPGNPAIPQPDHPLQAHKNLGLSSDPYVVQLLQQSQNREGGAAETPQTGDTKEGRAALRTSGDGSEHPERCLLASNSSCSRRNLESTETMTGSIQGSDVVESSDSRDHWTEASCPE
ncbi:uncharacterized protein PHA67_010848 isoform 1-T1 [Liasis olivaceus]